MAFSLLRRPCGVLASSAAAAAVMSLSVKKDTGRPSQDWRIGTRFRTTGWWAPLAKPSGTFVACEDEEDKPVQKLRRTQSKTISSAESWTQKQVTISKNVKFDEILAKSALFQNCPKHLIDRLAEHTGSKIFAKRGVKLIKQNEITDKLFVIGKGSLVVEVNETPVAHLGAGECVGERGVMTTQIAKADVSVASASAFLLVIDKAGMTKAMEEDPNLLEDMLSVVSRREVNQMGLNVLTNIPSFSGVSQEFLESMAGALKLVSFKKDEAAVLLDEADNKGMYFIMTGEMGVFDAKGQIATLGPNSFFGESMLLNPHATRSATVQALEFVEAFQLSRGDFMKVGTRYPKDVEAMKKVSKQRSALLLNRKTSIRTTG